MRRQCHPITQADNTFRLSTSERFLTRRSLSGIYWNDEWELKKAIYCLNGDGEKEVSFTACIRK